MTITYRHNGREFTSIGTSERGYMIWPIEEYLARRKHTPAVAERIRRLNPNGKEEGSRPKGWHPNQRNHWLLHDCVPIRKFREMYGSAALRSLPKGSFMKLGGKRRAITMMAALEFQMDRECL